MKLLTIVIPSFNSEDYLANCLDNLLIGLDDKLEVIVVNDGSVDKTSEIAHEYASKHSFIKVIDKVNGGHGSAINVASKIAEGLYFKVLDSDDKLSSTGLNNLIKQIEIKTKENNLPDVFLSDYVCVSQIDDQKHVVSLKKYFPKMNEVLSPDEIKKISNGDFIMLHAIFVKTSLLKEHYPNLLEKTFYEDNQFVYHVVIHANSYCYVDEAIYLYSVGRIGQSISFDNMMKNYSHQLRVFEAMSKMISSDELAKLSDCKRRLVHLVFFTMCYLSFFYAHIAKGKDGRRKYKQILKEFKKRDKHQYATYFHRYPLMFLKWILPCFRRPACKFVWKSGAKKKGWSF